MNRSLCPTTLVGDVPFPTSSVPIFSPGVRVRVGVKDGVGVQSGRKFPSGAFGARGASGAFVAHGLLRPAPLATNWGRGGGVVRVRGPAELAPPGTFMGGESNGTWISSDYGAESDNLG